MVVPRPTIWLVEATGLELEAGLVSVSKALGRVATDTHMEILLLLAFALLVPEA